MFFPAPQCFLFYRCQFWRSPVGGDVAPILDSSSSCSRMFEAFSPLIGDFKQPCRNDSLWLPLLFSLGLESDILSHDGGDKAAQGRTEGMDCVWGCVFFFKFTMCGLSVLMFPLLQHRGQSPHAKQRPEVDWWSGNRTVCLEQIGTGHLPLWWSLGRR